MLNVKCPFPTTQITELYAIELQTFLLIAARAH